MTSHEERAVTWAMISLIMGITLTLLAMTAVMFMEAFGPCGVIL